MSEPVSIAARLAATVVVLRPAGDAGAPEILMVRRARGASFMADAFVFPGGRVDAADHVGAVNELGALRVAAARELLEEASVRVDSDALKVFARWITPSREPKRFDTYFFLADVPPNTIAVVDATEVTEHVWATAANLLRCHDAREIKLPPPTLRTLDDLATLGTIAAVMAWAASLPIVPIQPKLVAEEAAGETVVAIVLPWDPRYADEPGEGIAIAPSHPLAHGAGRYVLRDGRFWATS